MEKERIQFYADPELKRRIEDAAAKHNLAVAEYCLEAVKRKMADDGAQEEVKLPKLKRDSSPDNEKQNDVLMDKIHDTRERMLIRRGGMPIDADALEVVRNERLDELTGMS